ncbi:MAG: HIT family protein [Chloroflexota bacterium]|nr:HIT family protein [Chloroflexota bacterium]PLS78489.1 MAG: HIT family protein [Chloroflexota bacterium]
MDCIFCRIVAGEIPSHKVYEDDMTLAFLDIHPAARGHTLVIPKQHVADLLSADPLDLEATVRGSQVVARILHKHLQADGINVVQNNGTAAGQDVFHYHVHLIPRWTGDQAIRSWRPGETDHAALGSLAAELRAAEGT